MKRRQTGVFQHLLLLFEFLEVQFLQRYCCMLACVRCFLLWFIGEGDLVGEDARLLMVLFNSAEVVGGFVPEGGVAGMGGKEGAGEQAFHRMII